MGFSDDYLSALIAVAGVFRRYRLVAGVDAVLVGGAAVNVLTDGSFHSGDFDIQALDDDALDAAFLEEGFIREDRQGQLRFGYYHPAHPLFGFQQVSGALMDGRTDRKRLQRIRITMSASLVLPPVEDLIADRLGQHAVASPTDDSRLRQARALFALFGDLDLAYLRKRVAEEGGDMALLKP